MKKDIGLLVTIVGFIILLGVFGYLLFSERPPQEPSGSMKEIITRGGTYICLPHADTSGPTTLECAFGLKTDDGENYALDFTVLESVVHLETNDRIEVTGPFTPVDALGADNRLRIYDIVGVMHVTSVHEIPNESAQGEEAGERYTFADDTLSFVRPEDFGIALRSEQMAVINYIPPCNSDFDYCLYYSGNVYEGTNFESAGLRINQREDLKTREACLTTQPQGYTNLTPSTYESEKYATSIFEPVGEGATGHYTEGALYRLAFENRCYEFETRIGMTQFANYEPGAVEEFTEQDKETMRGALYNILESLRFVPQQEHILFP